MQITFDTQNPKDLALLDIILSLSTGEKVQPTVTHNGGTTATGLTLSPEGSGVSGAVAEAAAPAPVKEKKAKKPVATAEEAPTSNTSVADTAASVASSTDKPLSLDEVRAALQQFTASNGVPAGIELLKKYNAARISELGEEHYGAFIADCQ
jgi:hypothetical protein